MSDRRFDERSADLYRPFAPNAVKFKVQAQWPKENPRNGLIVTYVDARTVSYRLNLLAGADWSTRFEPWGDGAICYLTVQGVTRADVGKGGGFEKEKAAVSDALKRAAVHFGIGAYLYSLSAITLGATENGAKKDGKPTLLVKGSKGKKTLEVTPAVDKWLRENYFRWLASDRNTWGEALDHGDEPDAVGDPVEREQPTEPDLELAAAKQEVDTLYNGQNGALRRKFKPGMFKAQLEAAETVADVDALTAKIKELA